MFYITCENTSNIGVARGIEAGLSDEAAAELAEDLDALEPMEGKSSVQDIQKWRAAVAGCEEEFEIKMTPCLMAGGQILARTGL